MFHSSAAIKARDWYANVKRLVAGRPKWSAEREFAYYAVNERVVREHRERQGQHERECYFSGMRTMREMGILDSAMLRNACVLDLGAGESFLAEAIARADAAEVWAVDAVPKQIWAAAEKYAQDAVLRFVVADATDLPFADASFDLAVAHLTLHHIEPLAAVAKELMRILRPGGRFVAAEPNPLVGMLVHQHTSANEAPIGPGVALGALRTEGFADVEYHYSWSRLGTSALGPFSPGYVVSGRKSGADPQRAPVRLRRSLAPMHLPGLQIDSECAFAALAREQEAVLQRFVGAQRT